MFNEWWEKQKQALYNATGSQKYKQPEENVNRQRVPSQPSISFGQSATGRASGKVGISAQPSQPVSAAGFRATTPRTQPTPTNVRPGASPDQMVAAINAQPTQRQSQNINPYSLYYAPDQIVDSKTGQIYDPSGHGLDQIAFRGQGAYAKAYGFTPVDHQLMWPDMSMGGGGSGGGQGYPFVYQGSPPPPPALERAQSPSFNMQDPYPAPQRGPEPTPYKLPGEPPATYKRDEARYRKLLGY